MKNLIYMSYIKLLPCPFCGGEAELYEQKHKQYPSTYYVTCKSCHCKTIESRVKGVAISGWNTRKPMERIVEQLEEKALVKECDVGGLVPSREKIVILSDAIEIVKQEAEKFGTDINVVSNGWISCSERLPEVGKRYLVSAVWKDKDFEKSAVYDAVYGIDGLWHSCNYEPVFYKVIAWQPLPEPFKESE